MKRLLAALLFLLATSVTIAAPYDEMDYGPFLSHTFQLPNGNTTLRGVAVAFDAPIEGDVTTPGPKGKPAIQPGKCGVIFDTELLRYSGYWNGGFITWGGVVFNGSHGANPGPAGTLRVATKMTAGIAGSPDRLVDSRAYPHGPMTREAGRYQGLYRSDAGVVFAYTIGDVLVHDMPMVKVHEKQRVFGRALNVVTTKAGPMKELYLLAADVDGGKAVVQENVAVVEKGDQATVVQLHGDGASVQTDAAGRVVVKLAANQGNAKLNIVAWSGPKADVNAGKIATSKWLEIPDLSPLTKGSKARFPATVTTKGIRGDDKDAYTLDSITPPFANPYKSWMRIGGVDFFADGRAAVSTWSGDVWIVSGLDDKLEKVTWKRYAAGLFHALGLKIVNDQVYVLGRDQITRLHDLNQDGEADFYECFNNEAMITTNFHEFTFDLHTDKEGNFYFIKGGPVRPGGRGWDKVTPHHGCIFKVSKDGSKLDVVARGFRAPNGMGVGPNGEITSGDNEGTWTPTCPINWIKQGGFYGVPDFAGVLKAEFPKVRANPLCWMPHDEVDNSNGGQVWITSDKFGPLSRQLLHMSYGKCKLYAVLKDEVAGQMQGGVVHVPLKFDSGVCRARFNDADNALYLTGLRGWQTSASKDAGFYRVRYTAKKANLPVDLKVRPGEIAISFSDPLDKASAADADNYALKQWNYRWTENYGSAKYKISDPKKQGMDEVEVQSARVSADGRTVTLLINDLKPVMQMKVQYNVKAADGAKVQSSIWHTINAVGSLRGEVHVGEYKVVQAKE